MEATLQRYARVVVVGTLFRADRPEEHIYRMCVSHTVDVIVTLSHECSSRGPFGAQPAWIDGGKGCDCQEWSTRPTRGDFVARIVSVGLISVLPTAEDLDGGLAQK